MKRKRRPLDPLENVVSLSAYKALEEKFSALETELKNAQSSLETTREFRDLDRIQLSTARNDADAARKDRDRSLLEFDDLKTRVHDLELENAELRGYLNRVSEVDQATAPSIRVDSDGKTTMRKDWPEPRWAERYRYASTQDYPTYDGVSQRPREPKVHWVNYGK